jgi:sodium/potassium-transporting ATPase subunit beta
MTSNFQKNKVWLSCEGRQKTDQEHLGAVEYYPEQGFPGYYYPFRNQIGFKSPVVAMHILEPKCKSSISLLNQALTAVLSYFP